MQPTKRQGFTLIELLIVIAIIGLLAGMLLPVLAGIRERANIVAVRSQIKNLEQAIAEYESDFARYPPSAPGTSPGLETTVLVYCLDGDKSTVSGGAITSGDSTKLYYEFKEDALNDDDEILDVWQRPLQYRENRKRIKGLPGAAAGAKPARVNGTGGLPDPVATKGWSWQSYDLWSKGPEGTESPNTDEWIGNWN